MLRASGFLFCAFLSSAFSVESAVTIGTIAQGDVSDERMITGTNVRCRELPWPGSKVMATLNLGERFVVRFATGEPNTAYQLTDGRLPQPCWVSSQFTTAFAVIDSETALLGVIQRQANQSDLRFSDFLELERLLKQEFGAVFQRSGRLQHGRLRVLARALSNPATTVQSLQRSPASRAWVMANEAVLQPFVDGYWYVRQQAFQNLYDKYSGEAWAGAILWSASQVPVGRSECEGYPECYLGRLINGPQIYWTRYPTGEYISDALAHARWLAEPAVTIACARGREDYPADREQLRQIRASLDKVTAPGKEGLLGDLAAIERRCFGN